jgi:RING finger/CHY zinc finger protein 1
MSVDTQSLGCTHYRRNCQIEAPCCKEFYWCRFCHNDAIKSCKVEEMDRHAVSKVRCMLCQHQQPPKASCDSCNALFASYFCDKCKFYDNTPNKHLYHCDECGICRVGKREDYIHCNTCGVCMVKDHKCTKIAVEKNNSCPVCLEDLFTSRSPRIYALYNLTFPSYILTMWSFHSFCM